MGLGFIEKRVLEYVVVSQKLRVLFWWVPIAGGLYWGPLVCGNSHITRYISDSRMLRVVGCILQVLKGEGGSGCL